MVSYVVVEESFDATFKRVGGGLKQPAHLHLEVDMDDKWMWMLWLTQNSGLERCKQMLKYAEKKNAKFTCLPWHLFLDYLSAISPF